MSELRAAAQREWVIWSIEHKVWWKPNRCGYTTDIAKAGRYSFQEAQDICLLRSGGAQIDEVMVPAPEAIAALSAQAEPSQTATGFLSFAGRHRPQVDVDQLETWLRTELGGTPGDGMLQDALTVVMAWKNLRAALASTEPPLKRDKAHGKVVKSYCDNCREPMEPWQEGQPCFRCGKGKCIKEYVAEPPLRDERESAIDAKKLVAYLESRIKIAREYGCMSAGTIQSVLDRVNEWLVEPPKEG